MIVPAPNVPIRDNSAPAQAPKPTAPYRSRKVVITNPTAVRSFPLARLQVLAMWSYTVS